MDIDYTTTLPIWEEVKFLNNHKMSRGQKGNVAPKTYCGSIVAALTSWREKNASGAVRSPRLSLEPLEAKPRALAG